MTQKTGVGSQLANPARMGALCQRTPRRLIKDTMATIHHLSISLCPWPCLLSFKELLLNNFDGNE